MNQFYYVHILLFIKIQVSSAFFITRTPAYDHVVCSFNQFPHLWPCDLPFWPILTTKLLYIYHKLPQQQKCLKASLYLLNFNHLYLFICLCIYKGYILCCLDCLVVKCSCKLKKDSTFLLAPVCDYVLFLNHLKKLGIPKIYRYLS